MKRYIVIMIVLAALFSVLIGCSATGTENPPETNGATNESETVASAIGQVSDLSDSEISLTLRAGRMGGMTEGEAPSGDMPEGGAPSGEMPEGEAPTGDRPEAPGDITEGEAPTGDRPELPEGAQDGEMPSGGNPPDGSDALNGETLTLNIAENTEFYRYVDETKQEAAYSDISVGSIVEVTYDKTSLEAITVTIRQSPSN